MRKEKTLTNQWLDMQGSSNSGLLLKYYTFFLRKATVTASPHSTSMPHCPVRWTGMNAPHTLHWNMSWWNLDVKCVDVIHNVEY